MRLRLKEAKNINYNDLAALISFCPVTLRIADRNWRGFTQWPVYMDSKITLYTPIEYGHYQLKRVDLKNVEWVSFNRDSFIKELLTTISQSTFASAYLPPSTFPRCLSALKSLILFETPDEEIKTLMKYFARFYSTTN